MLAAEVIAQRAIGQLLRINSQMSIATRIVIDVIGAEQKRIDTHERARQALGVKNQGGSSHAWPFGVELDFELTNKQSIDQSIKQLSNIRLANVSMNIFIFINSCYQFGHQLFVRCID